MKQESKNPAIGGNMPNYAYVAVDPSGSEQRGTLDVVDQHEALRRIKQMGLFPTRILTLRAQRAPGSTRPVLIRRRQFRIPWFGGRVKPSALAVFTRQLSTLLQAGMPLLRGLRTLQEQAENRNLKPVIADLSAFIEGGNSLTEALAAHPKVFNKLYVNMAKAGEIGGALEITLRRLSEFLEKAERVKGKVKAALYYPGAVLSVALGIFTLLMIYIVPRFRLVFEDLTGGRHMPAFSQFIFNLSQIFREHALALGAGVAILCVSLAFASRTGPGRWAFDWCKLNMPILGPVFRKASISRFSRTLGTLVSSGVPILQSLTIVRETVGNMLVANVVSQLHANVKEGDAIAPTLKASRIFPAMVAGMVDVGEQTGALPEMLMTVADTYDQEVDNAVSAMTSLLEPILIVILAVIVGSIVIALFLPLITVTTQFDPSPGGNAPD